jgi:hypothetical protein
MSHMLELGGTCDALSRRMGGGGVQGKKVKGRGGGERGILKKRQREKDQRKRLER